MDWQFVIVVYESSGRRQGYLRWSFANVRWELEPELARADSWRSESAAQNARDEWRAGGGHPPGWYAAVEQRRA